MKATIYFAIVFSVLVSDSFAQGVWTQKAFFPGLGKSVPFCFSIGTKGYLGTGVDSVAPYGKDFWEYDQLSNTWTQKANYGGTGRFTAVGFAIGNKGYAGFGEDSLGQMPVDFWQYDPATNTWTSRATFPGQGRFYAVSFVANNMGYVTTGVNFTVFTYLTDLWQYDPTLDLWTQKASLPGTGRSDASAFGIGTKGYVGIGWDGSNVLSDFWEYNAITNTWTQKNNFPGAARADAAAFAIDCKGYLGTGDLLGNWVNDFWQYNPVGDIWVQKADFGGSVRDECAFFSIGNKGYIGLGGEPIHQFDFYEFTPDSSCSVCFPSAQFISSDSSFCAEPGECIDFTDHSTCNPTSWQWTFAGGNPSTSASQNPTGICYSTPGIFPVTLIVTNAAGSDSITISPMITVGGTPPPPVITVVGGDTLVSTHASTYQWYFNGVLIPGATDSFLICTQQGSYAVNITDSIGCSGNSGGFVCGSGIEELADADISIYLNSKDHQLIIRNLQQKFFSGQLKVYNLIGGEIIKENINFSNQAIININSLSSGIYFIRMYNDKATVVKKFVKE